MPILTSSFREYHWSRDSATLPLNTISGGLFFYHIFNNFVISQGLHYVAYHVDEGLANWLQIGVFSYWFHCHDSGSCD